MEKIQTGLRIPKEQYDKLKAISDRTGISVNSMALHGLELKTGAQSPSSTK